MSKSENTDKPRILLLSAYDAASHRRWREQLVASQPAFDWHVLSLPPRFFRWRIRGNPLSWLDAPELLESWDLIVATSTVDVAALKGLFPSLAPVPVMLYMHENQFAYPTSQGQHQSIDPQMVNLYSALAADGVVFNSDWNRQSFMTGVSELVEKLPDAVPDGLVTRLAGKSEVLPVPIEDRLFTGRSTGLNVGRPHILWNHRWEYDKGPDLLLEILDELDRRGRDFRISVVGEGFRNQPEVFARIRERHGKRIHAWGFLPERSDYEQLLGEADVVLSTALHDFQGLAMLEAMAAGCVPVAPDRLAYPEYVPCENRYGSGSETPGDEARSAVDVIERLLASGARPCAPEAWRLSRLQPAYWRLIDDLIRRPAVPV